MPTLSTPDTAVSRTSRPNARQVRWRSHAGAAAALVVLVLCFNWPLVLNMNTHVIGSQHDDAFEVLWYLQWGASAPISAGDTLFYTPKIYSPYGWYLASGAHPAWYYVLLGPVTRALGPVATNNTMLLFSFVLAGYGVYFLAHVLTLDLAASLVAACVYMVAPVLTLRLRGHPNTLWGAQWLPWAALCVVQATRSIRYGARRGRAFGWALLAGVMLALSALSHC